MNSETKLIKNKLGLLKLAEELGNVSRACKYLGYSRETFYRYKELFEEGGEQALKDMNRRVPNVKNRIEAHIEERVVAFAIENPAFGQTRASNELKKEGLFISPCGVRCVWLRHDLETFRKRLKALEAKYDRKLALVAADMLNDRVIPMCDQYGIPLMRILTDRGTECCGAREHHESQLYLAIEDIDHTKTKAMSPQTNGICERFNRTMQDEFYATAFRKKMYNTIDELQADLDIWLEYYNNERPHSGKHCYGKTPVQTWNDSLHLAKDKLLSNLYQNVVSLPLSGEVETGSAGEQPVRNNLTDWNGQGGLKSPSNYFPIPRNYVLENPNTNT